MGGAARGILSFIAGAGQGYINEDRYQRDEARKKAADQRAQESHDAQMTTFRDQQGEKQALRDAAAPGTVAQDQGDAFERQAGLPRPYTVGAGQFQQRFDTEEAARGAAQQYNSPDQRRSRVMAALERSGDPLKAIQYDTAATQGEAAKFTLSKEQQALADKQFDKRLSAITSPEQLAQTLSGSPLVNGAQVSVVMSSDGKKAQLVQTGSDGQQVKLGAEFANDAKGMQKLIAQYSQSMDPAQKITAMMHMDQLAETQRHNQATEANAQQQLGISRQQLGISAGHLAVSQGQLALARDKFDTDLKSDPTHNLPGGVKLMVKGFDTELSAIGQQITKAQAEGGWDPEKNPGQKQLLQRQAALAIQKRTLLQQNGLEMPATPGMPLPKAAAAPAGDWRTAGGPVVAPTRAGAAAGLPGAAQAQPAAAFAPDPAMEQRALAENTEMGAGKRMQYSPEVRAYVQAKAQAEQQRQQAEGDAWRADEARRAAAATRGLSQVGAVAR